MPNILPSTSCSSELSHMNWPGPTLCCFSALNIEFIQDLGVSQGSCSLVVGVVPLRSWDRDNQIFNVGVFQEVLMGKKGHFSKERKSGFSTWMSSKHFCSTRRPQLNTGMQEIQVWAGDWISVAKHHISGVEHSLHLPHPSPAEL